MTPKRIATFMIRARLDRRASRFGSVKDSQHWGVIGRFVSFAGLSVNTSGGAALGKRPAHEDMIDS
jgi:hypothetical protein